MSILWRKRIGLLLLLLGILQIIHIVLHILLKSDSDTFAETGINFNEQNLQVHKIYENIKSSLIVDTSGTYRIIFDALKNGYHDTNFNENYDLSLVTHCSLSNIHHIWNFNSHWEGPISVAIFVSEIDHIVLQKFLTLINHCYPPNKSNILFSFVIPLSLSFQKFTDINYAVDDCSLSFSNFQKEVHTGKNYGNIGSAYPNNLLRNVAIQSSKTEFIFVIDVDMIPNEKLYSDFNNFMKVSNQNHSITNKIVYVVPAFESRITKTFPRIKKDLLSQMNEGIVRPFYEELCWRCQKQTNYKKWISISLNQTLSAGYESLWKDPWEPFFISQRNMPLFDERFKQYGFNRISQACELHVAGYSFMILNNAFLIHQGFKTTESFHLSKNVEQNRNRLLFRVFKEELKIKYSYSARRCY